MKKVVVGISGGVDSAVAVILLQNQGYEVIGVTFIFTDEFDASDATKVAEKLNIEHHIVDYRSVFKEKVIDKFIDDYNNGITPNPCVLCNRLVKFNFLYENMLKYNADYFATGHYAKVIDGKLYKSIDENKDQTYFLCNITKDQLNKVLFPLEGIDKTVVRQIASDNGLDNAQKKDSTDVCFIAGNFKEFMKDKLDSAKGPIVDVISNDIIGEHNGLNCYTIGQRRGLNVGGSANRMYVVGKDVLKNILYVSSDEEMDYLISTSCVVENVNLFSDEKINNCNAKFRYRQEEIPVKLRWLDDNTVEVLYEDGVKAVTPGQACAFYNENECLGGGIIKSVKRNGQKLWYL